MKAEEVGLYGIETRFHARIREMMDKHAVMWSGKLCEINTVEHVIDLKPKPRPVAVPPYRAGLKTRELEQAEVDRQPGDSII